MMSIADPRQFVSALIWLALGIATTFGSFNYTLGTATRMGPGYFPLCLGILLIVLGLVSLQRALRIPARDSIGDLKLVPLFFITASVVAFGFLVGHGGLIAGIAAVLVLSCYQRLLSHPLEVLATGAVILVLSLLIFVFVLRLAIPLW